MEYPGPWLPEPLAEPNQESAELASSLTTAFLVLLEQLSATERAVFLLREVFELDFDEIARSVGKSDANTRQILARARGRLRDARPRFTASRHESEEIVRRFRQACVTGNIEELMSVLQSDAQLVADGGGKAAAATRPVLGADRIAKFILGYACKLHWVGIRLPARYDQRRARPLMRHPVARQRRLLVRHRRRPHSRNLRRAQPRQAARVPRAHTLGTSAGLRELQFALLAEREQVAVDEVGMRGGEAVRQARIVEFRGPLDQPGRPSATKCRSARSDRPRHA